MNSFEMEEPQVKRGDIKFYGVKAEGLLYGDRVFLFANGNSGALEKTVNRCGRMCRKIDDPETREAKYGVELGNAEDARRVVLEALGVK